MVSRVLASTCSSGVCGVPHAHSHDHPQANWRTTTARLITPTNLGLLASTLLLTRLSNTLLNRILPSAETSTQNPASSEALTLQGRVSSWFAGHGPELLKYALQILLGLISWNALAKVAPQVHFHGIRPHFERAEALRNKPLNPGSVLGVMGQGIREINWRFAGGVVVGLTSVEALSDFFQNQTEKQPLLQALVVLTSFVAKLATIFAVDRFTAGPAAASSAGGIAAFFQSLLETCPCCGSIRALCYQLFPAILSLGQALVKLVQLPFRREPAPDPR